MSVSAEIFEQLRALGIQYEGLAHAPVHNMEDCRFTEAELGGIMPKNLLLTPRNRSAFALVILMPDAPFRTSDISKQMGMPRLSFAADGDLEPTLRTYENALSPLGLMFAPEGMRVGIDRRLRDCDRLLFHPNDSGMTVAISGADFFERFLPAMDVEVVDLVVDCRGALWAPANL